jgi:hypothetical protein
MWQCAGCCVIQPCVHALLTVTTVVSHLTPPCPACIACCNNSPIRHPAPVRIATGVVTRGKPTTPPAPPPPPPPAPSYRSLTPVCACIAHTLPACLPCLHCLFHPPPPHPPPSHPPPSHTQPPLAWPPHQATGTETWARPTTPPAPPPPPPPAPSYQHNHQHTIAHSPGHKLCMHCSHSACLPCLPCLLCLPCLYHLVHAPPQTHTAPVGIATSSGYRRRDEGEAYYATSPTSTTTSTRNPRFSESSNLDMRPSAAGSAVSEAPSVGRSLVGGAGAGSVRGGGVMGGPSGASPVIGGGAGGVSVVRQDQSEYVCSRKSFTEVRLL